LGALAIVLLGNLGVPVPGLVSGLARFALVLYGLVFCVRLLRFLGRRFLWRIRTKLLLSYLFIAVVPVVLLGLFFFIAGVLLSGLVAAHLVRAEIDRIGQALQAVARTSLAGLPEDDAGATALLAARLAPARPFHPRLAYAVVRHGRTLASAGEAPRLPPRWWKGPGFAGLVKVGEGEVLRAVWAEKDALAVLEVPVDEALFADLAKRLEIRLLTRGGRIQTKGPGFRVELSDDEERRLEGGRVREISGMPLLAAVERTDWETGEQELEPMTFQYKPFVLAQRLSPGSLNTADFLVKGLAIVGGVFLVMYCVALLFGLVLARSITKSVHSLSVGTERLRRGDFDHPIRVRTHDQLGELAESFNMMARGIQDLLHEQVEKQRLEEELRIARTIQMSLLPQGAVGLPGLRIAALCLPAAEVGGDYYDLLPLSESRMGVLVADVSGKGTSAALYMAELKGLVLSLSRIYESPARLLQEANRILTATMDPRSFITMTYAVVDTQARTMRYARAGHNPIIQLESGTGRTRVLTPAGLGLGIDPGERFDEILEEAEVPLTSGDIFVFFTDGLSEAMNVKAELFGERRLRDVVEGAFALGSEELKERILADIRSFVGDAAQHDDMTMVILKVV
jgi:serine phosphatase RsbU (regulator of sigma subunit)